jgi:hypothetical protein
MPANVIRIWPVDDFSKASKANPGVDVPRISAARWRTANEVAWSYGEKLDVFVPQSDATRTVYTAAGGVRLVALRPDGTGALVAAGGAMSAVDMQTGAASRTGMAVGQVVVPRGVVLR